MVDPRVFDRLVGAKARSRYGVYIYSIDSDHSASYLGAISGMAASVSVELKFPSFNHCLDLFDHINKSISVCDQLRNEEILRKNNPTLQHAYEEYRILLNLYNDNKHYD